MKGPDNSSSGDSEASPASATSVTLLDKARQGDHPSWERLLTLYRPLVLWWCRARVASREDAEDVAQEVFTTVFGRLGEFTKSGSFRGWLKTITYHKLGDHFRCASKQPTAAGGSEAQERLAEVPDLGGDDAPSEVSPSERCLLLRSALDLVRGEFEVTTWQAAWQTAVEGRPAADVAAALGLTTAAVYIAKSRVLKRLREELAHLLD
jgi:RNA polymerase sigma-70 factor (ECF subfamily)